MAMIQSLLAAFGAAVAGFFGHLLAHDFAETTPKLSRNIIQRAARLLRKADRKRYSEEWLADLSERSGVFAKLKHAIGCLLCARHIRRQSQRYARSTRIFQFEVANVGVIELDGATSAWAAHVILWSAYASRYRWLNNPVAQRLFYVGTRFRLRHFNAPNIPKLTKLLHMLRGSKLVNVKISSNGKLFYPESEK